jgi:hypothetical protein
MEAAAIPRMNVGKGDRLIRRGALRARARPRQPDADCVHLSLGAGRNTKSGVVSILKTEDDSGCRSGRRMAFDLGSTPASSDIRPPPRPQQVLP